MSIMVGLGRGAQHGVLVRGAEALEVDTLRGKTGSFTESRPKVVCIGPTEGFHVVDVLQKLNGVERTSEHPLATAVCQQPKRASCEAALLILAHSGPVEFQPVVGNPANLSRPAP